MLVWQVIDHQHLLLSGGVAQGLLKNGDRGEGGNAFNFLASMGPPEYVAEAPIISLGRSLLSPGDWAKGAHSTTSLVRIFYDGGDALSASYAGVGKAVSAPMML